MSEETKISITTDQAIAELIDRTLNGIDAGTEFMQEQLPDYIHQLLVWFMWYNIVWAMVWMLGVAFCAFCAYRLWRIDRDPENKEESAYFLIGAIPGMSMFFVSMHWWLDALQIYVAPKVFLVNYASGLLK